MRIIIIGFYTSTNDTRLALRAKRVSFVEKLEAVCSIRYRYLQRRLLQPQLEGDTGIDAVLEGVGSGQALEGLHEGVEGAEAQACLLVEVALLLLLHQAFKPRLLGGIALAHVVIVQLGQLGSQLDGVVQVAQLVLQAQQPRAW